MKHKSKILIIISLLTILLISSSYAWLKVTLRSSKNNFIKGAALSLKMDDSMEGGINLTTAIPIPDEEGLSNIPYRFTINNDGEIDSTYTIYLDNLELDTNQTRVDDKYIKYSLTKNGISSGAKLLNNRELDTGIIDKNTTDSYELRIWVDYNATNEAMNTTFKGQIRVEGTQTNKE